MRQDVEPPSRESPSNKQLFVIGRNSRGNWVVRDQSGLRGGLFVDRTEALRFALLENGRRPQAVLMVPVSSSSTSARPRAPRHRPKPSLIPRWNARPRELRSLICART
jgi:hypothetical protein